MCIGILSATHCTIFVIIGLGLGIVLQSGGCGIAEESGILSFRSFPSDVSGLSFILDGDRRMMEVRYSEFHLGGQNVSNY